MQAFLIQISNGMCNIPRHNNCIETEILSRVPPIQRLPRQLTCISELIEKLQDTPIYEFNRKKPIANCLGPKEG